jgi:hypothetical protein
MSEPKRRSANALQFKRGSEDLRNVKLEAKQLQEKLQKSIIDNPQTAKKAALLISMWMSGKTKKKAG